MIRLFIFLIGFGFTVLGSIYIISYLNLISFGYKFSEYVNFIIRRVECIYMVIGFILIIISISAMKGEKYELHL